MKTPRCTSHRGGEDMRRKGRRTLATPGAQLDNRVWRRVNPPPDQYSFSCQCGDRGTLLSRETCPALASGGVAGHGPHQPGPGERPSLGSRPQIGNGFSFVKRRHTGARAIIISSIRGLGADLPSKWYAILGPFLPAIYHLLGTAGKLGKPLPLKFFKTGFTRRKAVLPGFRDFGLP